MSYKFLVILYCLLVSSFTFSQEVGDALDVDGINFKVSKKHRDNTDMLMSRILKGKSTDKEKFDAIFYWVAKNISYDISSFYTASNSGPDEIAKILQTRKTICLGYAQLMDSLCALAGIPNVTVFGYAKDRYYDVGDSIYGHNHAWNAVKLDDLWYVYDVTWSKAVSEYKYTKKALLILRLLNKFPEKFKKKTIRIPRKFRKRSVCKEKIEPIIYYKQRYFNRLIRLWLLLQPIKVYQKINKGISTDFYLSDPKLFSISHVPDDPIWSLLNREKSFEFEQDSSFYYLTDTTYKNQEHKGEVCANCDSYYASSKQRKLEMLNTNSLLFNNNNRFVTTYCHDELAKILFYKSLNADDNKLQITDTAVFHLQNSLTDILLSKNNLVRYFTYEKNKNDKKAKLLLTDNVNHVKFFKSKVKTTISHGKSFQEIINKSEAFASIYSKNLRKVHRYRIHYNFEKMKPYAEARVKDLHKNYLKKTQLLDSINSSLMNQINQYDSILTHLSLNIWPQIFRHDTILIPFKKSIKKRQLFYDNYKKAIIDIRRTIYPLEYKYTKEIDDIIYKPAVVCENLFVTITKLIKLKQALFNDLLKIKLELTKAKESSETELNDFKLEVINQSEQDFCWLAINFPKVSIVTRGMYQLSYKQNYGIRLVNFENEIERYRQSELNKAIKLGYKGNMKSMAKDIRVVKLKVKEITNYRKEISDPKLFNQKRYDRIVVKLNTLYNKKL